MNTMDWLKTAREAWGFLFPISKTKLDRSEMDIWCPEICIRLEGAEFEDACEILREFPDVDLLNFAGVALTEVVGMYCVYFMTAENRSALQFSTDIRDLVACQMVRDGLPVDQPENVLNAEQLSVFKYCVELANQEEV